MGGGQGSSSALKFPAWPLDLGLSSYLEKGVGPLLPGGCWGSQASREEVHKPRAGTSLGFLATVTPLRIKFVLDSMFPAGQDKQWFCGPGWS